jgi:hypothetical protein
MYFLIGFISDSNAEKRAWDFERRNPKISSGENATAFAQGAGKRVAAAR